MKQQILRYWLAMNATAFDAAVHSVAAFFGVAGAHAISDAIPALTSQQFAAMFFIAFGRAILAYLDAHPLTALLAPGCQPVADAQCPSETAKAGQASARPLITNLAYKGEQTPAPSAAHEDALDRINAELEQTNPSSK